MTKNILLSEDLLYLEETDDIAPYLFRSSSGSIEFIIIEDEMEKLNDYCVVSTGAVQVILDKYQTQAKLYSSGKEKLVHQEIGDVTSEALMGLEDVEIPKWEHMHSFLAHATCLLLLHVFVEKSLKSLCSVYAPNNSHSARQIKGLSMVDSYIKYLKETCSINVIEPEDSIFLRENIRKIRNDFAHGDWDNVEETTKKVSLRHSFETITMLLESIEDEANQKNTNN